MGKKYNEEFNIDRFKSESVQLSMVMKGLEARKKHNRELIQFYRKKRNCLPQLKQLREDQKAIDWMRYVNGFVQDFINRELLKFPKSMRYPKPQIHADKKSNKKR